MQETLKGRKHMFFEGHLHSCDCDDVDGVEDIAMAPADAAVPGQPGPGNVDHAMRTGRGCRSVAPEERSPQMQCRALKRVTIHGAAVLVALSMSIGCTNAPRESDTAAGHAATAAAGRSLGIASVPNLRDLGGYETSDGTTVAMGLIYRSDQLSGVGQGDMEKLAGLGLKNAYDLRTAEEREKRPEELPPGVNYVVLDVLADSPQAGPARLEKLMQDPQGANAALGGGKAEAGFQKSYREFVSLPSARREFGKLFLALGERERLPALFHCTTGKDRTGWAAAAFLTLMGVPRDKVFEDYLRSNDYIIPAYQTTIDGFVAAGGDSAIPIAILGVKREYLDAAFDEMETMYGTVENYFSDGLGIDAERQRALRDLYLGQR